MTTLSRIGGSDISSTIGMRSFKERRVSRLTGSAPTTDDSSVGGMLALLNNNSSSRNRVDHNTIVAQVGMSRNHHPRRKDIEKETDIFHMQSKAASSRQALPAAMGAAWDVQQGLERLPGLVGGTHLQGSWPQTNEGHPPMELQQCGSPAIHGSSCMSPIGTTFSSSNIADTNVSEDGEKSGSNLHVARGVESQKEVTLRPALQKKGGTTRRQEKGMLTGIPIFSKSFFMSGFRNSQVAGGVATTAAVVSGMEQANAAEQSLRAQDHPFQSLDQETRSSSVRSLPSMTSLSTDLSWQEAFDADTESVSGYRCIRVVSAVAWSYLASPRSSGCSFSIPAHLALEPNHRHIYWDHQS